MENPNSGKNGKVFIWLGIGCLSLALCVVLAFVFGIGGLAWFGSQTPENVIVEVKAPIEVSYSETFKVELTITNNRAQAMEIISVDFSQNYLRAFFITYTEPKYIETWQFDALGGGETFVSYIFRLSVLAGETVKLVFGGRVVSEGDFSGRVDVCIDSQFSCMSNVLRTITIVP